MNVTSNQLAALKWLRNRNGDGVFERNNSVVLAGGERAPVMRSTWNNLAKAGLVEFYNRRRLRVTEAGKLVDVSRVEESRS
jgi:hypothetical protein